MTAQEPEILIYNGEEFAMISNPDIEPKAIPGFSGNTSNYRGYVGVWEINDSKLYLNKVKGGSMRTPGPHFANWITQKLEVWKGNLLSYVHAGYGSVYEETILFDIENGILKNIETESNIEAFKEKCFERIQNSSGKNIRYLYEEFLSQNGMLSKLIEKSTDRKQDYISFQQELEFDLKQRLIVLSEDPNSGIVLKYK